MYLAGQTTASIRIILMVITRRCIAQLLPGQRTDQAAAMEACYPEYQTGKAGVVDSDQSAAKAAAKDPTKKPVLSSR